LAILRVNPTRMELSRLKKRLKTAMRGHKLLKDKRDELMKQFLEIVRHNRELRKKCEQALMNSHQNFTASSAVMSPELLEQALLYPKQSVSVEMSLKNIMSANVPKYEFVTSNEDAQDIYPYGFAQTSGELDDSVKSLSATLKDLLELARIEKTAQLLSREIEKTRRRVNALEYVMIPQLTETIRYISMKLDENERSNLTRLMKVKDMMLESVRQSADY
jgi:V/A-type H+-transporting ATPase subunit D